MRRDRCRWALLISSFSLLFYLVTLLPSTDWEEGARCQLNAYLGRANSTADGHAVYFWLGRLFSRIPSLDPGWSINLSSAVYGALAIFFFVLLGFQLLEALEDAPSLGSILSTADSALSPADCTPSPADGGQHPHRSTSPTADCRLPSADSLPPDAHRAFERWAVTLGSASLALSHTYWFCSAHPRPLALNGVLLAAVLYVAVSLIHKPQIKKVLVLSLISGLSLGVHLATAMLIPVLVGIVVFLQRQRALKLEKNSVLVAAGCFLLGALPYIFIFLLDLSHWRQLFLVVDSALRGLPPDEPSRPALEATLEPVLFWIYNFLPWGVAVGLLGIYRMRRHRPLLCLLAACFAIQLLAPLLRQGNPRHLDYHPAWVIFALFAVVGWRSLLRWKRQLAWPGMVVILFFPPIIYSCTPALLLTRSLQRYSGLELSASADLAEAIRYRFNPSGRGDSSARRFGENLLYQLPPQTRLLAYYRVDPSTYFIATFLQKAEGRRSDVTVDNLRGYDGTITLENLFQTYPDRPVLYISRLNGMYETGANRVEAISDAESSPGARVYRVTWTGRPAATSSLSPANSNWTGHMSLLEPALGLRVLYRDELWYVRLRFQNALLYPREGRVDHLRIQAALISFSFSGLNYAGKIFQDRILGEWAMPSDPELHGEWEVRKQ